MPKFKVLYEYEEFAGTVNDEPSLTDVSRFEECDLGCIMASFGIHRFEEAIKVAQSMPVKVSVYGDDTFNPSLLSALDLKASVHRKWSALSDIAKAQFSNNPKNFYKWCSDPEVYLKDSFRKTVGLSPLEKPKVKDFDEKVDDVKHD